MAVAEQEKTGSNGGGGAGSAALKAAAAAAATGAATYAVKRVRSHDSGKSDREDGGDSSTGRKSGGSQSILASAAATSWEAAADALMPMAEDAAEAAGKYLATHGPDLVRERLVPKFIDAFNESK
jgi:hypothetical protein